MTPRIRVAAPGRRLPPAPHRGQLASALRWWRRSPGPRPGVMLALLVTGALASNAATATFLVAAVGAGTPWPGSGPRVPAASPARPAVDEVAHPAPTQPDDAVRQVGSSILPSGWRVDARSVRATALALPASCPRSLPEAAAPYVATARDVHRGDDAVRVAVLAYGAGLGGPAAATVRKSLAPCVSRPGPTPVTDAEGFAAVVPGRPASAVALWRRGDVVVLLTGAGRTPAAGLAGIAPGLDAALRGALDGTCADIASLPADAARNPVAPHPSPFLVPTRLSLPTSPGWSDPGPPTPSPTPLPAPVSHPELAPLLPAPAAAWSDLDGDGVVDTPPPVADAARGPAPVYADPAAYPAPLPADRSPAPSAPEAPAPPPERSVPVPAVDSTGPGCGWAFTGAAPASVDPALVAAAAAATRWQAVVDSAAVESRHQAQLAGFLPREAVWRASMSAWLARQAVVVAREEAVRRESAARSAYDESARAYLSAPAGVAPPAPPTTSTPSATGPTGPPPASPAEGFPSTAPTSPAGGAP